MTTNDLLQTLETIRSNKHQDLDAQLVADVVTAQSDFMSNPSEAYKRILQAVESFLERKETSNA
jgi:hypothetical protein